MSYIYAPREQPDAVRNKRTEAGKVNPRYLAAVRSKRERMKLLKELSHTFRHLSREEIDTQYTERRVDDLCLAARKNMEALCGPKPNELVPEYARGQA